MDPEDSPKDVSAEPDAKQDPEIPLQNMLPNADRSKEYIMGIDEAGRGPVLGPMVYGSAFCAMDDQAKLKKMGFADSKTLNEAKRDKLWVDLLKSDFIGWNIAVLDPQEISGKMLRKTKVSLNVMSHDTAIGLVQQVMDSGINLAELYVDTVGDETIYQNKLQRLFPTVRVTVAKKADSKFPIVSAASICAKVPRDKLTVGWKFQEGEGFSRKFGSGYPADPETKAWLNSNVDHVFGFPKMVRFSWSTTKDLLETNAAEVDWADSDDEDGQSNKMDDYFSGTAKRQKTSVKRHQHFKNINLELVESF